MNEVKRYNFKLLFDEWGNPTIRAIEDEMGHYCLSYHIQELQDKIFALRSKHNDWEVEE